MSELYPDNDSVEYRDTLPYHEADDELDKYENNQYKDLIDAGTQYIVVSYQNHSNKLDDSDITVCNLLNVAVEYSINYLEKCHDLEISNDDERNEIVNELKTKKFYAFEYLPKQICGVRIIEVPSILSSFKSELL